MTIYQIKKPYSKYFQKSRTFLLPILGLRKAAVYAPLQSYLMWDGMHTLEDERLILTFQHYKEKTWDEYLLNTLMANQMFDEYHELESDVIAISFDLNCISADYRLVLEGKYGQLSKLLKAKIRDYYGYNSAEWAYIETFLYPSRYVGTYSKLLAVDEEHIKFTGQLCDLPNLDQETLKLKPNGKINDARPIELEQIKDI